MNFKLLAELINPRSVIDIGSNNGHWHNESRLNWLDAEYLLIEAQQDCEPSLIATGAKYKIAVLSDSVKQVPFYTRKGSPSCTGASLYRENTPFYDGDNAIENLVWTTTLDSITQGKSYSLIKLDCQGAELDILKGGLETLSRAKAVLTEVSVSDYNPGAPTYEEMNEFLISKGFRLLEELGDITHPLDPSKVIQKDVLYIRDEN